MISDTTIVDFTFEKLTLELTEPFAIASGAQQQAENILIKIYLQDGTIGLGEAAPFPAVSGENQKSTIEALARLKKYIVQNDVKNWVTIAREIKKVEEAFPAARCGIEMAILDALTKHYKIPLYIFFGGAGNTLETDMTITSGDEAHAAASAKAIIARGISTIKIKTAGTDIDFDVRRVKAIHQAAPSAALIIDGNCGYTIDGALIFIDQLSKQNIKPILFEQPLKREDLKGMRRLVKDSGIKIAADESVRSVADVFKIISEKSAHVLNIKIMKCGIAEALQMIAIAEAANIELMIGGMVESILSMTFSAHIAAGRGSFSFVDLDTPMFIKSHPFKKGFKQKGGMLSLDISEPGHGVELR